jgi:hypothetical protein
MRSHLPPQSIASEFKRATLEKKRQKMGERLSMAADTYTHSHTLMQHLVQQLAVEILRRGGEMRCK